MYLIYSTHTTHCVWHTHTYTQSNQKAFLHYEISTLAKRKMNGTTISNNSDQ